MGNNIIDTWSNLSTGGKVAVIISFVCLLAAIIGIPLGLYLNKKKPDEQPLVQSAAQPEKQSAVQPAAVSVVAEQPAAVSVVAEQPAAVSVVAEQPAAVSVVAEQPAAVSVVAEQPAAVSVVAEQPAAVSVVAEQPAAVSVVAEQPPDKFTERLNTILDYWDTPYKVEGNLSVNECKTKCENDIKCKAFMRMYPKSNLSVRSGKYNNEQCAYLSNLHNPKVNNNGKGFASLYVKN